MRIHSLVLKERIYAISLFKPLICNDNTNLNFLDSIVFTEKGPTGITENVKYTVAGHSVFLNFFRIFRGEKYTGKS